jgi:hypothetical protein
MKFNRKVLDLARKLDYVGITPERRNKIIVDYSKPINKILG